MALGRIPSLERADPGGAGTSSCSRVACVIALLALLAGCGGTEPARDQRSTDTAGSAAEGGNVPGAEDVQENAAGPLSSEEPLGAVPADVAPQRPAAPDLLALEQQPGVTPALPQVEVAPGPAYSGLPGAPGPSPAMGPDDAAVKVFVFSDFQCPVCRRVVEPLKHLAREYPKDVQIVFKHNALGMHAQARGAAAASVAAFRQGKFWEYHDLLFEDQAALGESDLLARAERLGLDLERFRADMTAPAVGAQLDYEAAMADRLGAPGTPGFFINGTPLLGWGSYPGFKAMVDTALERARTARAAGAKPERVAMVATAGTGPEGRLLAEVMWGVTD